MKKLLNKTMKILVVGVLIISSINIPIPVARAGDTKNNERITTSPLFQVLWRALPADVLDDGLLTIRATNQAQMTANRDVLIDIAVTRNYQARDIEIRIPTNFGYSRSVAVGAIREVDLLIGTNPNNGSGFYITTDGDYHVIRNYRVVSTGETFQMTIPYTFQLGTIVPNDELTRDFVGTFGTETITRTLAVTTTDTMVNVNAPIIQNRGGLTVRGNNVDIQFNISPNFPFSSQPFETQSFLRLGDSTDSRVSLTGLSVPGNTASGTRTISARESFDDFSPDWQRENYVGTTRNIHNTWGASWRTARLSFPHTTGVVSLRVELCFDMVYRGIDTNYSFEEIKAGGEFINAGVVTNCHIRNVTFDGRVPDFTPCTGCRTGDFAGGTLPLIPPPREDGDDYEDVDGYRFNATKIFTSINPRPLPNLLHLGINYTATNRIEVLSGDLRSDSVVTTVVEDTSISLNGTRLGVGDYNFTRLGLRAAVQTANSEHGAWESRNTVPLRIEVTSDLGETWRVHNANFSPSSTLTGATSLSLPAGTNGFRVAAITRDGGMLELLIDAEYTIIANEHTRSLLVDGTNELLNVASITSDYSCGRLYSVYEDATLSQSQDNSNLTITDSFVKSNVSAVNNQAAASHTITYRLEYRRSGAGLNRAEILALHPGFAVGRVVFYDLLPIGTTLNEESLRVFNVVNASSGSNNTWASIPWNEIAESANWTRDVTTIPNYNGTGRTLLRVEVRVPSTFRSNTSTGTTHLSGIRLEFSVNYPWINQLDFTCDIRNVAAGRAIGGLNSSNTQAASLRDLARYFTFDYNDAFFNQNEFRLCGNQVINTGFTKLVSNGVVNFTNEINIERGEIYTYRLRYSGHHGEPVTDLVIIDVLERHGNFRGDFVAYNLSQLELRGIDVTVYYSTVANPNINDLTSSDWTTSRPDDLSMITALAFCFGDRVFDELTTIIIEITLSSDVRMVETEMVAANRAIHRFRLRDVPNSERTLESEEVRVNVSTSYPDEVEDEPIMVLPNPPTEPPRSPDDNIVSDDNHYESDETFYSYNPIGATPETPIIEDEGGIEDEPVVEENESDIVPTLPQTGATALNTAYLLTILTSLAGSTIAVKKYNPKK